VGTKFHAVFLSYITGEGHEKIHQDRQASWPCFSLFALTMLGPEVVLAGPGCMKNQPMGGGYYPHSSMGPHAGYYAQGVPYRYNTAAGAYAGIMAVPYNRPVYPRLNSQASVVAQAQQPAPANASRDNDAAGEGITVRINGMRFEPARIIVKPGTTVTWVQESPMPHTIIGNATGLGSGTLYNGQTYSHTFEKDGLFNYYCGIHPSMTGSVVVEETATDS
jgi:plastocyanin